MLEVLKRSVKVFFGVIMLFVGISLFAKSVEIVEAYGSDLGLMETVALLVLVLSGFIATMVSFVLMDEGMGVE